MKHQRVTLGPCLSDIRIVLPNVTSLSYFLYINKKNILQIMGQMSRTLAIHRGHDLGTLADGFVDTIGQIHNMRKRWSSSKSNGSRKRYRSNNSNGTRIANSGANANTYQNDATVIQRARRPSGRFKRRARSFKRFRAKVRAVESADVPNSSVVRQSTRTLMTPTGTVTTGQGFQRSTSLGFGDQAVLQQIFDAASLDYSVGSEDTVAIRGGACELQIRNVDDHPSFLDIYELVARKNISSAQSAEAATQWGAAYGALANVGGAPDIDTWGVTPFEAPAFCKMWKIIRTTRLQMSPSQVVTIERTMKCGSRRVTGNQLANFRYLKGMRAWLFVSKGVPLTVSSGDMTNTNVAIRYNQTWHYEEFSPSTAARSLIPVPP